MNSLSVIQWSQLLIGRFGRDAMFNLCCDKAAYAESVGNATRRGCNGCSAEAAVFVADFYDNVQQAIAMSETQLAAITGFDFSPLATTHTYDYAAVGDRIYNPYGQLSGVRLERTKVVDFGVYSEASWVTVPIDPDTDIGTYQFQASITTQTPPPENAEYIAYYATDDCIDFDQQRVQPLKITVTFDDPDYTITIQGDRYNLIPPRVIHGVDCCDETDDGQDCYVSSIEVFTRVIDTTDQGAFIWNGRSCTGEVCAVSERGVCLQVEGNHARPHSQEWNSENEAYSSYAISYNPTRLRVNSIAGLPLTASGEIQSPFAQAIAYLSVHYLQELGCHIPHCSDCDKCATADLFQLAQIPSFDTFNTVDHKGGTDRRTTKGVSGYDFESCPFTPPTLGAVRAWHIAQQYSEAENGVVLI